MRLSYIFATLLLSHPPVVKTEDEDEVIDDGEELNDYDYELVTDEEIIIESDLENVICP